MPAKTLTLNVTNPALIDQIGQWADGAEYTFTVRQTAPDTFDVLTAEESETPAEEATGDEPEPAAGKGENPAMAVMVGLNKKPK